MKKLKHITVSQEVYQTLKDLGKTADSFNDVLVRISAAAQGGGEEIKNVRA
jgi:predicted CopG family antitoxin